MTPSPVICLLVDDLEENLLALSALLRRDGVMLLQARSGREALELLLLHEVALALIDVQMPDMDGFELAELMRGSERTRQVPIIFVTAGSREPYRVFKGYNSGAVDFLYKPIDPLILESKAAVFFELYRQRLRLADELQQRTETLRLNEMFTAVLSHDLRNPLNAIMTAAFMLQRQSQETAVIGTAERILTSGKRMSRMIEDMLDLTRVRLAGGIVLSRTHVDLAALIERVVQEHRTADPQRTIELRVNGDAAGEWDADRVQQLASNLIGNALQHGERHGAVQVTVDGSDVDRVIFSIHNLGAIPPDRLPGIFDPFRGGNRAPGRSEGLGLGLFIAQQIVLAHGGQIDVESEDAIGTAFRVAMPRRTIELVRL
jgi:two-component system, sensor histidine kinase and response regulator